MMRALALALFGTLLGGATVAATPTANAQVGVRARDYKTFLDQGSTARRAIIVANGWAKKAGFRIVDLDKRASCRSFSPGDKLIFIWQRRTAMYVRVGKQSIAKGATYVGAHVDAPALRLTAAPFGKNKRGWAQLTSYRYGGIKQFHYHNRALKLVGTVTRRDGSRVAIELGPKQGFSFVVSPEVPWKPPERKPGEPPKPLPARIKLIGATSGKTPAASTKLIHDVLLKQFKVRPRDIASAEIYAVPSMPARDVGLSRKMIGSHGQDDRSLSFAALRGLLEMKRTPNHTAAALLVDREETGSRGRTGAKAPVFEHVVACLARGEGKKKVDAIVQRSLSRSIALSTDVKSAINPNWPEVQEHKNAPRMGKGPTLVKFTGHGGKRNASDANPGLSRWVRTIAARAKVPLQRSETGKVDQGGGGTIAKFMARRGMNVIDVGVPLLSMHAPMEIVNKQDLSWCVDLFKAFYRAGPPKKR